MSTNFLISQPKLNHFMMGSKYNEANLRWHSKQLLFWQSQSTMPLLTLTVLVVPVCCQRNIEKKCSGGIQRILSGGWPDKMCFLKTSRHFTEGHTDLPWEAIGPIRRPIIAPRGGSIPVFPRKPITTYDFPGGSPTFSGSTHDVLD